MPFWISIAILSVAQGGLVALARPLPGELPTAHRAVDAGRSVPPLSVLAFVAVARAAEDASAETLTYLALVAVPLLAALALGWLTRGARPARALIVVPLFALAWADRGGLAGEGAALALSGLSCVSARRGVRAAHAAPLAGGWHRCDGTGRHGAGCLATCSSGQTTRSTPHIRPRGCRVCRARSSARP